MTYEEYLAQEQLAMEEEQNEESCFLEYQPEGQFVRGHWETKMEARSLHFCFGVTVYRGECSTYEYSTYEYSTYEYSTYEYPTYECHDFAMDAQIGK